MDYLFKKTESERWKKGEPENYKKGVEVWCRGRPACVCVCVCGGGGGRVGGWLQLTLFSFSSRFISFSLEITLPFEKLCYAFEKKNLFLLP